MDWLGLCRKLFLNYAFPSRVLNYLEYKNIKKSCRFLSFVQFSGVSSSFNSLILTKDCQQSKLTSNEIRKSFRNFSSVDCNPHYINFSNSFGDEERKILINDMVVIENFLSIDEEQSLLNEVEPYMKRLRYEFAHWDDAIHGYRETERLKWNLENTKILDRIREIAFPANCAKLQHVHVLDLAQNGYIKPHIDATRFCGNIIAGVSLLSDSVMRLVHDKDKNKVIDILLKQRSLYIMRDCARYDYTHEILANEVSKFKGQPVLKTRRISVICRNEPLPETK